MTKLEEFDVIKVVGEVPGIKPGLYRLSCKTCGIYDLRRLRKPSIPILPDYYLDRKPTYLEDRRCKTVTLNSKDIDHLVVPPGSNYPMAPDSSYILVVSRWGKDL